MLTLPTTVAIDGIISADGAPQGPFVANCARQRSCVPKGFVQPRAPMPICQQEARLHGWLRIVQKALR